MIVDAVYSHLAITSLITFIIAYVLVVTEEFTHLNKSKPVLLAAGIIWILVAILAKQENVSDEALHEVQHTLREYVELFLFLLVAMTYVNLMQERRIFEALRSWLVSRKFSLRKLYWTTGLLAFVLSPLIDNLTTALIMCAVVLAVGNGHKQFISLACINIVLAANAGGVYSPFGDITSLMIWQNGALGFFEFYHIFMPALVSYLVPAIGMSLFVPNSIPEALHEHVTMRHGALVILFLFAMTLVTAISFRLFLNLPPVLGMMTGLSYLNFYGYYLQRRAHDIDIIRHVENAEWDTMLFFYGIMLCVSGLAAFGYLHHLSNFLYIELDLGLSTSYQATPANVILGLISAVIDNIPVVYAVLTMQPEMSKGQWQLITLTAGIGGSIFSVGSAAGVALMGQAKNYYTFMSHLKWAPLIILGYAAGVAVHLWLNQGLFTI